MSAPIVILVGGEHFNAEDVPNAHRFAIAQQRATGKRVAVYAAERHCPMCGEPTTGAALTCGEPRCVGLDQIDREEDIRLSRRYYA